MLAWRRKTCHRRQRDVTVERRGRASGWRHARGTSSSALVGVQAAASVVLLVLAALLARGMVRATHVDVGFDAGRLLTVAPAFGLGRHDAAGAKACTGSRAQARAGASGRSIRIARGISALRGLEPRHDFQALRRPVHDLSQRHTRGLFCDAWICVVRGRTFTAEEAAGAAPRSRSSARRSRAISSRAKDPLGQLIDRIQGSRAMYYRRRLERDYGPPSRARLRRHCTSR